MIFRLHFSCHDARAVLAELFYLRAVIRGEHGIG